MPINTHIFFCFVLYCTLFSTFKISWNKCGVTTLTLAQTLFLTSHGNNYTKPHSNSAVEIVSKELFLFVRSIHG